MEFSETTKLQHLYFVNGIVYELHSLQLILRCMLYRALNIDFKE